MAREVWDWRSESRGSSDRYCGLLGRVYSRAGPDPYLLITGHRGCMDQEPKGQSGTEIYASRNPVRA